MAMKDGYATVEQYRAARGDFGTAYDGTLELQLVDVSRLLEMAISVQVGAFNAHNATYTFNGHGGPLLRLRDTDNRVHFLRTVVTDGIGVDEALDGTFSTVFDLTTETWVRGLPENAATAGEPYRDLEILRHRSPTIYGWLNMPAAVSIEGGWGWAEVPGLIRDLVIHRTGDLRDSLKAGGTGELGTFDGGVPMRPVTAYMFREAERLYGPGKIPGVA